jgi:uncharacterized protein (TIGR00106 family)
MNFSSVIGKGSPMKILVNFSVVPMGAGASVSGYVAACAEVLKASGLTFELHANGTNIEGEWDAVLTAVRHCIERLEAMGVPRVYTTMSIDARFDKLQTMASKVKSVER